MKVNMTPNPLDVVTIHASQGDTEARQWEFELHNNGELIDTSDVKEQLVFKAYKGGTEQLLPENTSTPTTSPFLGDIKYPQGLLTDQEFTYRQSPTESDGLAKITDIKGNTLNWNQLVQNGNFVDTSYWNGNGTKTVSNNELTYTKPARWNSLSNSQLINLVSGHKYLAMFEAYCENDTMSVFWQTGTGTGNAVYTIPSGTSWQKYSLILTSAQTTASGRVLGFDNNSAQETIFHLRNYIFIDLTMMGLDALTLDEVKEWLNAYYPLPYYDYNVGTLLSFKGTGIKTVGKNIFDGVLQNGTIDQYGQEQSQANRYRSGFIRVLPNTTYCSSVDGVAKVLNFFFYDGNQNFISSTGGAIVTTPSNCAYIRFFYDQTILNANLQVEIGSTATSYEPYTSSTLSLPISTYFPTGMKSAGNAYDELQSKKAITRINQIDLGSLNWTYITTGSALAPYFMTPFNGIKSQGTPSANKANILCSKYQTVKRDPGYFIDKTICADGSSTVLSQIQIKDSSYTDATAFKQAMTDQNVKLYYELATPTETSFTTASLVTENGEIPLSNNDGVLIGKCTEQLSENPGFIDAKIKLSDSDGECYSNKIQLHIERSPQ